MTFTPSEQVAAFLYLNSNVTVTKGNADYFISNLEPMRADWPRRDFTQCHILANAYQTLAAAYFCKGDYGKAVTLLEDGIAEVIQLSEHSYKILGGLHHYLGHVHVCAGNDADALANFREFVFYSVISHTHYNVREFYSFRSVSKFSLKDLEQSTITMADPDTFNDVVDCLITPWMWAQSQDLKKPEEIKEAELLQEAWSYVRIRCFAFNKPLPTMENPTPKPYTDREEYSNTLMWSHYANMHQGFCIRYQFPATLTHEDLRNKQVLVMGEVQYVDNVSMASETFTLQKAFFTKSKDWSYEHEKRLLYYDLADTPQYNEVSVPEDSVTDIYFGVRCPEKDRQSIIAALKGKNVKYHQMVVDLNDIYRLLARDYNP